MPQHQQLAYDVDRYPPPIGLYYDEDYIDRRLSESRKVLDDEGNTGLTLCCPHCWQPRHGEPILCIDQCGTCGQRHPAPCPIFYCTTSWWNRIWQFAPPGFVQLKPSPDEEQVLIEAKIVTKNENALKWHIKPANRSPEIQCRVGPPPDSSLRCETSLAKWRRDSPELFSDGEFEERVKELHDEGALAMSEFMKSELPHQEKMEQFAARRAASLNAMKQFRRRRAHTETVADSGRHDARGDTSQS